MQICESTTEWCNHLSTKKLRKKNIPKKHHDLFFRVFVSRNFPPWPDYYCWCELTGPGPVGWLINLLREMEMKQWVKAFFVLSTWGDLLLLGDSFYGFDPMVDSSLFTIKQTHHLGTFFCDFCPTTEQLQVENCRDLGMTMTDMTGNPTPIPSLSKSKLMPFRKSKRKKKKGTFKLWPFCGKIPSKLQVDTLRLGKGR